MDSTHTNTCGLILIPILIHTQYTWTHNHTNTHGPILIPSTHGLILIPNTHDSYSYQYTRRQTHANTHKLRLIPALVVVVEDIFNGGKDAKVSLVVTGFEEFEDETGGNTPNPFPLEPLLLKTPKGSNEETPPPPPLCSLV